MILKRPYGLPVMLVLACLLLMLFGYSTTPVLPPIDQAKPEIPLEIPARAKPEAAMAPCNRFPSFPTNLNLLVGKIQAEVIISRWNSAAEAYALCNESNRAMSIWIRAEQ